MYHIVSLILQHGCILCLKELQDDIIPVPAGFVIQSPGVSPYPAPNVTPNGFQWQPAQLPKLDIPPPSPAANLLPQVPQSGSLSRNIIPNDTNQDVYQSSQHFASESPLVEVSLNFWFLS